MAGINSSEILLESGTNELEIMEFKISGKSFGINVAKIKEILQYTDINPMPNSHPCVEGVFKPRDLVITVVNLPKYMGFGDEPPQERDILIITNFNKLVTAFHVHSIEGINRISWEDIEKPDTTIYGGEEGLATGIAKVEGRLITIIDFEKVLVDISPFTGIQMSEVESLAERPRSTKPILIAEDSMLLKRMICDAISTSGYTNIVATTNGKEAWDLLESYRNDSNNPLTDHVACVITDIEMPVMDGHRLTKLIKDDKVLKRLPVIIFSSLIDDEMRIKGKDVGADA
ncbi:MAG: chemotaxis protein, partial [Oscillospiraceae bacterium]|nr:chemotaxis protein [Oscillospiraceae bacterium]